MTVCIHCNRPCRLVPSKEIYPDQPKFHGKWMWKCTKCDDSYVGCHPGTKDALGFAADYSLRRARMLLHEKMKGLPRSETYRYLSRGMGIPPGECHVGMFDIDQCREAWVLLANQEKKRR